MYTRFQFSLTQICVATTLAAVAACLAKAFYDAIPIRPWQAVLPIASCASLGAAIGSIVSPRPAGLRTGFLAGAIVSSVIIVLLLAYAMFMDYIFAPILQNG